MRHNMIEILVEFLIVFRGNDHSASIINVKPVDVVNVFGIDLE